MMHHMTAKLKWSFVRKLCIPCGDWCFFFLFNMLLHFNYMVQYWVVLYVRSNRHPSTDWRRGRRTIHDLQGESTAQVCLYLYLGLLVSAIFALKRIIRKSSIDNIRWYVKGAIAPVLGIFSDGFPYLLNIN